MSAPHILVVDDEPDLRTLYELTLVREGYQVHTAENLRAAWECLQSRSYQLVITDMRLPDGFGIELVRSMRAALRPERCVVITAYGSAQSAVESLKAGAFDYLTKPVDLREFRNAVASALLETATPAVGPPDVKAAPAVNALAEHPTQTQPATFTNAQRALDCLVGTSAAMVEVKKRIAKVARSMAPVFIHGESGTGKELVANALHANSHRGSGPLVAVNCGAIPENLLEAEFFGARKGAYTGATHDRPGYFRAAQGGTLFLDEIGDLPLPMQAKLLRAIQERRVRALGDNQEESVDVRIISATHKDLAQEVLDGRFRQDLYYRLNVIDIAIPPLRERRDDLAALCESLIGRIARESGVAAMALSPASLALLDQMPLRGNVRELENLLHRAMALSEGDSLQLEDAGKVLQAFNHAPPTETSTVKALASEAQRLTTDLQQFLDDQEREILVRTLHETNFNRTLAASRLGLTLRQIRYRIARLNIDAHETGADQQDV